MPDVFLGTVPVCRYPYALHTSLRRDDGDVLRDVGWDWDTPADRAVCLTTVLVGLCSGDDCADGENMFRFDRAVVKI